MMKQMARDDAETEQRQRLEEIEREKQARAEVVEGNRYLMEKRAEEASLQGVRKMLTCIICAFSMHNLALHYTRYLPAPRLGRLRKHACSSTLLSKKHGQSS